MTALQARNERNKAINAARLAKLGKPVETPAAKATGSLLAELRDNTEGIDIIDGVRWGSVYLRNVGQGHSFAGHLSALEAKGLYRPTGNDHFGLIRMD